MAHLSEIDVFKKTLYAEARGEPEEGIVWVAWVIKNRAAMNRSYWGGNTIKAVCLHPQQFECWNAGDFPITDGQGYAKVSKIADNVYGNPMNQDPTGGADHYNNPTKEGFPAWTNNCIKLRKIGEHQFYKSK